MHRPKYSRMHAGKLVNCDSDMRSAYTTDVSAAPKNPKKSDSCPPPTIRDPKTSTHSQATASTRDQSPDSKQSDNRGSIDVGPSTVTKDSKLSTEFEVALKKLRKSLPSTIYNRVSEKQDQCIASKISPVGARCTRVLGRSCDSRGELDKLIERLEANDHLLLSRLRTFMESSLCGRSHKAGACMALQEVQDLEPNDAELEVIRVWLQDLLQAGRKAEDTLDSENDVKSSIPPKLKPSEIPSAEKASNLQQCLSRDAAPIRPMRPLPRKIQEQVSKDGRSQKRKASTLVPPIEPKRIHDEGIQQTDVPGSFFGSMSPIVVSPTETTYDSPSEDEEVFDEEFKSDARSRVDNFVATPLTPPTSKDTIKVEVTSPESPLLRKSKNIAAKEGGNQGPAEDDYFRSKKIFRNTTFEMNNITNSTLRAGESPYSQEIDTEFRVRRSVRLEHARSDIKKSRSPSSAAASPNTVKTERDRLLESTTTTTTITKTISGSIVSRMPAEKVLEHIIPFEVKKRLAIDETTCVASLQNKGLTRCNNTAKKFSKRKPVVELENLNETSTEALNALKNLNEDKDREDFLQHIENFIKQALCGSHAAPARKRLSDLDTWLQKPAVSGTRRTSTSSPLDFKGFEAWLKAITSSHQQPVAADHREAATAKSPNAQKDKHIRPATVVPSSIPKVLKFQGEHFEPWQPKSTVNLSVNQALRDIATKPLTPSDINEGFIYVFWLRGVFGLVKIGLTRYPKKRLEQWNRQCQRDHEYHAACYDADMIGRTIKHVSRVERLIHTELKNVRLKNRCQCSKVHREWFKGTEEHVLKVFLKWRDWVDKEPYGIDSQGKWTLKPEFEQSLDEVCRPFEETKDEASSTNMRRSTPRRRSAAQKRPQK